MEVAEAACKLKASDLRASHLTNILQNLSKLGWKGNRKLSQGGTSNQDKDKDGNKQVLDKIWQSVSPGRGREAEGRGQRERLMPKTKHQAEDFRAGPVGNRKSDEIIIT